MIALRLYRRPRPLLRQILSTLGLFASILAFLIGAAIAVAIVLLRPELGPGLKDVQISRAPQTPLYETLGDSEPLRRLLITRARKSQNLPNRRARPSLAKAAVAWPQEQAGRRALAALARERTERRLAELPKRRLDLGPNQKYHTAVAEAAMLTGLSPAAIAALIDAEARKTRSGAWDPKSSNSASSARGMAQFLEKTWLEQARNPDRFLYREALRRGLIDAKGAIRKVVTAKASAKIAPPKKSEQDAGQSKPQSADTAATPGAKARGAEAREGKPAVKEDAGLGSEILSAAISVLEKTKERTGRGGSEAPETSKEKAALKKNVSRVRRTETRNLRKLLNMRLEPRIAIIAAAELAADNLVSLARSGYAPKDDEAAAKLAYLAHHEGLKGARAHLAGVVNRSRAEKRLKANISEERAERLLAAHNGKPHRAYAAWLEDYIAKRIQPERFHSEVK